MKKDSPKIVRPLPLLLLLNLGIILPILGGLALFLTFEYRETAECIQALTAKINSLSADNASLLVRLEIWDNLPLLLEKIHEQNGSILEGMTDLLPERGELGQTDGPEPEYDLAYLPIENPSDFTDQEEARVRALEILNRSPFNREALTLLGRSSYEEGCLEQSLEYFSRLAEADPGNREACLTAARSARGLKDFSLALIWGERLLRLEEKAEYWFFQAECFKEVESYDQAVSAVERALNLNNRYPEALDLGGRISLIREDYEAAKVYYSRALEIQPQKSCFVALGDIYYLTGSYNQAYDFWSRAAAADPVKTRQDQEEQLNLYEKMAVCAYESGDMTGLDTCLYRAGLLGGRESIEILALRRDKDLNRTKEAIKKIGEFKKKYPRSSYERELDNILSWARGE